MSTLKAATIVALNGTSPVVLTGQSAAKAWGHFEGSDATLDGSFNTSSLTDVALGRFTPNLTNNMSSVNYTCTGGAYFAVGSSSSSHVSVLSYAIGSVELHFRDGGSTADLNDSVYLMSGDLA